jgi:hypothetical protein
MRGPWSIPGLLAVGFANPWLLLGLALAAAPILIHLLYARAYRQTDWAAMRFLLEAARKNSRRMRLEQLLLLAVRTLIVMLMVGAFAEPYIQSLSPAGQGRPPLHRVLVIDSSFSMQQKADGGRRFDRAKTLLRQIVSGSRPGDAFNLLGIAGRTDPAIVREPTFDRDALLAVIDRLEPTAEPGDLAAALADAAEMVGDPRTPPRKEVVLISDLQRRTWTAESPRGSGTGLSELFRRIGERARIVLIDVGEPAVANAAVTSLETGEPITFAERPARFRATLRNYAPSDLPGQRVELYVDGYLAAFKAVDLLASAETVVEFPHEFHSAGEHAVEVRLPADALPIDDRRWLSVPVADRMRILIVDGRRTGRPAQNASYYVRTVLAPATAENEWKGATRPEVIPEADLAAKDLSRYDCVFLCNVALVTPTEAALLQSYVEAGGGLIVAVGDRVSAENYNTLLYRDGKGVLPARLGDRVGDAADRTRGGFTFDAQDLSHPVLAPFRGNPAAGLDRAVTLEFLGTRLESGSPARAVLRFNNAQAAIVERPVGRGRSVLITTSTDVTWSAWPVHPTFPPLIHELVRFAAAGRWQERQRLVGEPLVRVLPTRDAGVEVVVKPPDGRERPARPTTRDNQVELAFTETERPGIYELTFGSPGSESRRELFAVNVDPVESDLARVVGETLRGKTLSGVPHVMARGWNEVPGDDSEPSAEPSRLAFWLVAAALGLLFVEPLLAWNVRLGLIALGALVAVAAALPLLPESGRALGVGGILLAVAIAAVLLLAATRSRSMRGRWTPAGRAGGRPWTARVRESWAARRRPSSDKLS